MILRILAVSDYDWSTAFLVSTTLSLDDGVSLLFGSLMAGEHLTGVLLAIAVPLLLAATLWGARERRATLALLTSLGVALSVALLVSENFWWPLTVGAVLFGVFAFARWFRPTQALPRGLHAVVSNVMWLVPVLALVLAALIPTPWLPAERIDTTEGTIHGYVLSVDSGYLNVLTDEHEFCIINTTDVVSRQ